MQSVEISGLREVITKLDVAPELIREARAEFFAEAGASLLSDVQGRIGGTGKIAGVQEYRQRKGLCGRPGQGQDQCRQIRRRLYHQCAGKRA